MNEEQIQDIVKAVEASEGDVVFFTFPDSTSLHAFRTTCEHLRIQADKIRAAGGFFPRCIALPPGVSVEVARAAIAAEQPVA